MRALPVLLLAACGAPPPAPPQPHAVIATPASSPADVEVARVKTSAHPEGRPIWGSCVTAQAAEITGSAAERRDKARDQCVAFELLAQAAEARGLAAAPEVGEAERAAEVNRLVELDFDQRYQSAASLASVIDPIMQKNAWRMHLIQLRASTYARFEVAEHAPAELDAQAKALADRLAGELAGQTGLFPIHLREAAEHLPRPDAIKLEVADVKPTHQDGLVDSYAAALYGIPAVGQIAPAVRTKWGWDVVLWTGGVEPKDSTRDELVAELFPEVRRRYFQLWATQIAKRLGVHIEIDQAALAQLDSEASP